MKIVLKGSNVVFHVFEMINLEMRAVGGGFLVVHDLLMLILTPLLAKALGWLICTLHSVLSSRKT